MGNVIRFQRKETSQPAVRFGAIVISAIIFTFAAVFLAGRSGVIASSQSVAPPDAKSVQIIAGGHRFPVCHGATRSSCMVDGDTIWLEGEKIRIADIDTPEVRQPRCPDELARGMQATRRLAQLLGDGPFSVERIDGPDEDKYGRKLRIIVREGASLGDVLVAEGLARPWTGRRQAWCL